MTQHQLATVMDSVFGRGAWRMTGGYRTPARENQLRAQGARTVRPGGVSRHSLGRPDAPGAYDVVVNGMSPFEAADRLRRAGAPFARYHPKGAHGTQGPHLHLEPYGFGRGPVGTPHVQMASADAAPSRAAPRRPGAVTIVMPASGSGSLATARAEFRRLHERALQQDADAQLEVGRAYAVGYSVTRDFAEAQAWLAAAAANPTADLNLRTEAAATFQQVSEMMDADRAAHPGRYARLSAAASAVAGP